jgi:hypothetical protein
VWRDYFEYRLSNRDLSQQLPILVADANAVKVGGFRSPQPLSHKITENLLGLCLRGFKVWEFFAPVLVPEKTGRYQVSPATGFLPNDSSLSSDLGHDDSGMSRLHA